MFHQPSLASSKKPIPAMERCSTSPWHQSRQRRDRAPISEGPYFIDVEPKNRELYEAVTDTGEVLSGSSSTVSIGNSTTSSQSTNNFDIYGGWNFSATGGGAVASENDDGSTTTTAGAGSASAGSSANTGTSSSSGYQNLSSHTTDASTERWERDSHTTQLSQMYNLFKAFHVGTNRAMFLMEPRPHIRQSEATFINGPRALEGIQEVYLAVVVPKTFSDFCTEAVLETAHILRSETHKHAKKTDVLRYRNTAPPAQTGKGPVSRRQETYRAPAGWRISDHSLKIHRSAGVDEQPSINTSAGMLTIKGAVRSSVREGNWCWGEPDLVREEGTLDASVEIALERLEPNRHATVQGLFLSARRLCCCREGEIESPGKVNPSITYFSPLPPEARIPLRQGSASPTALRESRRLTHSLRSYMMRSLRSTRRIEAGQTSFQKSEVYIQELVRVLQQTNNAMHQPLKQSPHLDNEAQSLLGDIAEEWSIGTFLETPLVEIGHQTRLTVRRALKLKQTLLKSIYSSNKNSRPI